MQVLRAVNSIVIKKYQSGLYIFFFGKRARNSGRSNSCRDDKKARTDDDVNGATRKQ